MARPGGRGRWALPALAVTAALLLAAGCASPSSSGPPTDAPLPSTSPAAAAECPALTLRDPDGDLLNLTGTWRAAFGGLPFVFVVTQTGSCVAIEGRSDFGDSAPGEVRSVFSGNLTAGFEIVGRWTWTYSTAHQGFGTPVSRQSLAIDFEDGAAVIGWWPCAYLGECAADEALTPWTWVGPETELGPPS